jgi:diphthine synthase
MLSLIGLGLYGCRGISLSGLDAVKKAERIYLETYTSPIKIDLDELQKLIDEDVVLLGRRDIEEGDILLSQEGDVALLCPGDPLIATTHTSILLEAEERGIETRVYHAASIYSAAIGESGLHVYKFGRTATLTMSGEFLPFSTYDALCENLERGLHTLLLLEYDVERGVGISIVEAFQRLFEMEEKRGRGTVSSDSVSVVLCGLGGPKEMKVAGRIKDLAEVSFPDMPLVIIVPGGLHFTEKKALDSIWMGEDADWK